MTTREFAEQEFELLGWSNKDDHMQDLMCKQILAICDVFDLQGHSGFSASYAINIISSVLKYQPIAPLTGLDDEWKEVSTGLFQNKRDYEVFKTEAGAYFSNGRIFKNQYGVTYTNRESRIPIKFPWTRPKNAEIINVFDDSPQSKQESR